MPETVGAEMRRPIVEQVLAPLRVASDAAKAAAEVLRLNYRVSICDEERALLRDTVERLEVHLDKVNKRLTERQS